MSPACHPLMTVLMLVTWNCEACNREWMDAEEGRRNGAESRSWQYVSPNGTFPFSLRNIRINGTSGKRGENRGVGYDVKSRNEVISSRLLSVTSPLLLNFEGMNNEKCRNDGVTFVNHLNNMDLWALKMHDSSAKLPSGLLNGNTNQFGDFDECLSVDEPDLDIRGKYCLVYFQIRSLKKDFQNSNSKAEKAFELMQSHFFFRSKLTDPGHRVPRFSTLNWGLCVPHSCTYLDVESHLKNVAKPFFNGTGFDVEIKVEPEMCQEKKSFRASLSFLVASCLLLSGVVLACVATLKDVFFPKAFAGMSPGSLLHCFSLKRNGKALFDLSRGTDDVRSIHGIRMINALMLLICHKSMALFFVPYSNRTTMVEKLSEPWSIIARIASLYTDSFIMISGLLTSYSFTKTLSRTGKLDLKNEYLNRLLRIVPPLTAVILLSTFIIPELGSGPQWNLVVSHHADKCRKNWWKNLLFIHNYFGFENMCLTHTHHMGIDTQLFFISPLLVLAVFKWPFYGTCFLLGLGAASTVARYEVTLRKDLSFFIYPGITVSRMFDTANYSYIIPFHRLTSYVIGIYLGMVLRRHGKTLRMKSSHLRLGWTITFTFLSYILTKGYDMNRLDYSYERREAALYAALAPVAWCLFVGWIIFVSQMGCGGFLEKITSSRHFIVWTRLSYSVYLTQFPIFFINVGLQKYPQQYSIFLLVNVLEYASILAASVALTLLYDMPFVNIKKLLIQR